MRRGGPTTGRRATRVEQEARRRGARARSHYARVRERRAGRRRRRAALLGSLLVSGAAGAAVGALRGDALLDALEPPGLPVSTISVLGARQLAAREVAAATGVVVGTAIAELDAAAVARRVESHPWLRRASVQRAPGGVLLVQVEERTPAALLRVGSGDEWRLVERSGQVFASARPQEHRDLPRLCCIAAAGGDAAEAVADPRVPQALALLASEALHGLGPVASLALPEPGDERGWVLRLEQSEAEILLGDDRLEARLARLAELRALRPETMAEALRIDLRFRDRAIVRSRDGSLHAPRSERGAKRLGGSGPGSG